MDEKREFDRDEERDQETKERMRLKDLEVPEAESEEVKGGNILSETLKREGYRP